MGPFDIGCDAAELEAKPGAKTDARLGARQLTFLQKHQFAAEWGGTRGVGKSKSCWIVSSWIIASHVGEAPYKVVVRYRTSLVEIRCVGQLVSWSVVSEVG